MGFLLFISGCLFGALVLGYLWMRERTSLREEITASHAKEESLLQKLSETSDEKARIEAKLSEAEEKSASAERELVEARRSEKFPGQAERSQ